MDDQQIIYDENADNWVDDVISNCFDLQQPKSFFLFAGAGSGKTRSLVLALNYIEKTIGKTLKKSNRNVAVITYTNAARDEIRRRVKYNSLFEISTIHSFAWKLISHHTFDIKRILKNEISEKITEYERKQATSKSTTTKTYLDRAHKISDYRRRLEYIDSVKRFIYNPDGVNNENNSLDHAEVIKISSKLLSESNTMKDILIDRYPILLIDESQDTKKELMDVFLQIQQQNPLRFSLGLFGDTMQRIYLDGKEDLNAAIPDDWETPIKVINHRSQKRIVDLCNDIRSTADGIRQQPCENHQNGTVRLFITQSEDQFATEHSIRSIMADASEDPLWLASKEVKCLTIEHKMAACRLGFNTFFEPLNQISSYKQGLMNGTLSAIGLFTHILLPLHKAINTNNEFEKMRLVRENSLLYQERKDEISTEIIKKLQESITILSSLWKVREPTCKELLEIVYQENLFPISNDLRRLIENPPLEEDEEYDKFQNLDLALSAKFAEVERYYEYINGEAEFDTHQGVKGLEFDRVMVIIDDSSAQGNTFNYSKLFGVQAKSTTDVKNELEGKETTLDRTRRLFYVTCSRAKNSLAIVYYTADVTHAYEAIVATGWFLNEEIVII